jgi:hypothetical protein
MEGLCKIKNGPPVKPAKIFCEPNNHKKFLMRQGKGLFIKRAVFCRAGLLRGCQGNSAFPKRTEALHESLFGLCEKILER